VNKFILFCIFTALPLLLNGQQKEVLSDQDTQRITNYEVLPDQNYTIQKVSSDSTLPFITNDSLRPAKHMASWLRIRIVNPGPYSEECHLTITPHLFNTLFVRHAGTGQWQTDVAGMNSPPDGSIYKHDMYVRLAGKATTTVYVKVALQDLRKLGRSVKPIIILKKKASVTKQEWHIFTIWATGATLLLVFMLNYLYVYRSLREKTIFYFFLAQAGGLLYISSYWRIVYKWFPTKVFTVVITPKEERIFTYDTHSLLMHFSVALILYGLVQLTIHFLSTAIRLPRLHTLLKYSLYAYLLFAAILAVINTFITQVNYITLPYDNAFCVVIFIFILITSITGYIRKFPAARSFLFANLFPLIFMTCTGLIHVFTENDDTEDILPLLAIMLESFGYSIALVAFFRSLRQNLQQKEQEAQQLTLEIQEMFFTHRLLMQENQQIGSEILHEKTRNEALQQKLEVNQRELASNSLYREQKNEMLSALKSEIMELTTQYPDIARNELTGISSILKNDTHFDSDWEKFKIHLEQVHPRLFEELQTKYPNLTKSETRLYAYLHIQLSTKEIARLLNINPASVRQAKMRLYKKLALPVED
jgi:DNA-binding CsgD family transcriptional regulator